MNIMRVDFHRQSADWSVSNNTCVRGKILIRNEVQTPGSIGRIFAQNRTLPDLCKALKDLNGHYAIVHIEDADVYMVVDRNRGLPLFYGHDEEGLFLSDDPFWIQDQLGDYSIDERSKREFLLTGYVSNDRTLVASVKQVRSGEVVHFIMGGAKGIGVERGQHQQYLPKDYFDNDMEAGLRELDTVLHHAFQRLMDHAQGRTIVVPMSGGYDSRLTVMMLKKLGYDKVVAFSYGRSNNKESEISRSVANALGVRWEFVEYTNEKWHEWFNSEACNDFARLGSGLASSPYVQDFPAVMKLREQRLIPDDSIFVPGHTVSICNPDLKDDLRRMELAVDDVIVNHYNITGRPIDDPVLLNEMRKNVAEYLGDLSQYPDRNSAEECWDFNNRQSKFTNNNVRVYEYWGYDWWLPLVDKEFMDFWVRVPYELRLSRPLYKAYVKKMSDEMCGKEIPFFLRTMKTRSMKSVTKMIVKRKYFSRFAGRVFYSHRKASLYNNHPQAFFGMIPWEQYKKEFTGREVINHFIAHVFIDKIEKDFAMRHAQKKMNDAPSGQAIEGLAQSPIVDDLRPSEILDEGKNCSRS